MAIAPASIYRLFLVLMLSVCQARTQTVTTLPSLKANIVGKLTVSGFSSGGAMATQFHVAHSSIVSSVGAFSSTFYRCGPGGHAVYSMTCTKNLTTVAKSVSDAQNYEKAGKIDPLANLNVSKVFVWSGTKDKVVPTAVTKKVADFYAKFTPSSNIRFVSQDAVHEFPTDDFGPKCPEATTSFIGNCAFAGGFEMLSSIIGSSVQRPSKDLKTNPLVYFNQSEFTAPNKPNDIGLDNSGYYYVPSSCKGNIRCRLHFFFHGCTLGNQAYQPVFVDRISYLKFAEANDIIMVFPRAARVPVKNPDGCWDVYGQHGDGFATKDAVQITAIKKMVDRVNGSL